MESIKFLPILSPLEWFRWNPYVFFLGVTLDFRSSKNSLGILLQIKRLCLYFDIWKFMFDLKLWSMHMKFLSINPCLSYIYINKPIKINPIKWLSMQVVIEIPHLFIQTLIYGITVYAMIGFEWSIAKLFWYLYFMYFTLLYFTLYGIVSVTATPDESIASILSSLVYGLWSLFSGFIVPKTVSQS